MGWSSHHATHYKNGKVDRKAECDALFEGENYEVLASSMRGSVYYAAVKRTKEYAGLDEDKNPQYKTLEAPDVSAFVILTSTDSTDYFNFSYKDMHESVGPYYYDCPVKILDMLTDTDNENALEWRNECRNRRKTTDKLGRAQLGAKVKCIIRGEEKIFQKVMMTRYYKRPIWWCEEDNTKITAKQLNELGYAFAE